VKSSIWLLILVIIFGFIYFSFHSFPIGDWREFIIGRYYLFNGRREKAEREFEIALRKHPERSEMVAQIALFYLNMGKLEKAEETLKKAIKRKPSFDLYYLLGNCQLAAGKREEAEKSFAKAVEIEPSNPYALNNLAYIWVEEDKRLEEAVELLKRAVRKSKSPEILDSLGWAYVKLGEVEKGLKLLKVAVERNPTNWEIRYHLSVAYEKMGNHPSAKVEEAKAKILFNREKGLGSGLL